MKLSVAREGVEPIPIAAVNNSTDPQFFFILSIALGPKKMFFRSETATEPPTNSAGMVFNINMKMISFRMAKRMPSFSRLSMLV